MISLVSFVLGLCMLGCYGFAEYRNDMRWMTWGNIVFCVPLALTSVLLGALGPALLSMGFGVVAFVKVRKGET